MNKSSSSSLNTLATCPEAKSVKSTRSFIQHNLLDLTKTLLSWSRKPDDANASPQSQKDDRSDDTSISTEECLPTNLIVLDVPTTEEEPPKSAPLHSRVPRVVLHPSNATEVKADITDNQISLRFEELDDDNDSVERSELLTVPDWTPDEGPSNFTEVQGEEVSLPSARNCFNLSIHQDEYDDELTVKKKWPVHMGSNQNYIRALVNRDSDSGCKRDKDDNSFNRDEKRTISPVGATAGKKWEIHYDNVNYIRSLLRPETLTRILKDV